MVPLATFFDHDCPNGVTHVPQRRCGYSIYRGVLVQWDENHDRRVLAMLDHMAAIDLDSLMVVQEHEASASFLWRDRVPERYAEGSHFGLPDGDVCYVYSSVAIPSEAHFLESGDELFT